MKNRKYPNKKQNNYKVNCSRYENINGECRCEGNEKAPICNGIKHNCIKTLYKLNAILKNNKNK